MTGPASHDELFGDRDDGEQLAHAVAVLRRRQQSSDAEERELATCTAALLSAVIASLPELPPTHGVRAAALWLARTLRAEEQRRARGAEAAQDEPAD